MKEMIVSSSATLAVAVLMYAIIGVYGISIGSNDECTQMVMWVCDHIGIGGAR